MSARSSKRRQPETNTFFGETIIGFLLVGFFIYDIVNIIFPLITIYGTTGLILGIIIYGVFAATLIWIDLKLANKRAKRDYKLNELRNNEEIREARARDMERNRKLEARIKADMDSKLEKLKLMQEIDVMNGFDFEKHIKAMYEVLGYSVKHTSLTGDHGADLILTSKEGEKTAVQVKRHSTFITNKAVQEVVASKALYECTKGIVVTNNYFTDGAIKLARANNIELVNRDKLVDLIKRASQINENREETNASQISYRTYAVLGSAHRFFMTFLIYL